jgi:transposase
MDHARHQDRHDGERYHRVEVITGRRRRQFRSAAEKALIVAESFEPGANISEVARRHGINRGLLFTWRRLARGDLGPPEGAGIVSAIAPSFVPVRVGGSETPNHATAAMPPAAVALIEIAISGVVVRVPAGVDAVTLSTVLRVVRAAR